MFSVSPFVFFFTSKVSEWNKNELYAECGGNCTFQYRLDATPILELDPSRGSRLLNSTTKDPLECTWGDLLELRAPDPGGGFNWSAVGGEARITVDLGNGTAPLVVANFTATGPRATLWVAIPEGTRPLAAARLRLFVPPFGFGPVLGPAVTVRPVITGVSHHKGSIGGGLEVCEMSAWWPLLACTLTRIALIFFFGPLLPFSKKNIFSPSVVLE